MTSTTTLVPDAPPAGPRRRRIGWLWVTLSSVAVVAFAVTPYLTASLRDLADQDAGLASTYVDSPPIVLVAFYMHVVTGGLALLSGPWQFWAGLRRRRPRVHRATGRVYVGAVAVAGAAGLVLAPMGPAGMVGLFGFGSLAVLWLWTTWRGYRAIRGGDVPAHRAWMIRSFALAYAAVMLRLWTGTLLAVGVATGADPEAAFLDGYHAVPFLCWLPNLVVAELMIRRRGLPGLRLVDGPA